LQRLVGPSAEPIDLCRDEMERSMNRGMEVRLNGSHLYTLQGAEQQPKGGDKPRRCCPPDAHFLRRCAWEIGEKRAADQYRPPTNHVGLAMVNPAQGFAHWHISPEWVERTREHYRDSWHHCRMVLRLYDVSYIMFNGFNAHRIQDHPLAVLDGQLFFPVESAGTWLLAEPGFLLRKGEFIPAARSQVVHFPRLSASPHSEHTALLVEEDGTLAEVGNVWDQARIVAERNIPKLRDSLRIATFALESLGSGQQTLAGRFVSELAAAQCALGHAVHVFVPACGDFTSDFQREGVHYHPLNVAPSESCLELSRDFARAAEGALAAFPRFDLIHLHDWITGYAAWFGARTAVLSLSSIEATRRNGSPPAAISLEIERIERELSHKVRCLLVPHWLESRAIEELGLDAQRVHGFSMEGMPLDQWTAPLDYGHAKMEVGIGPLDRMLLFVGPMEHSAGVDLLVEALPVVLKRIPNARLAFAGAGYMTGPLGDRAGQLGVSHAVRLLGHVELPHLAKLLRAAEALILPSRCRLPFDDAVVGLARRARRPVVTTHGGPAHLVRHEENGIITYDNPGSMVWAMDRILGNSAQAEQMGRSGASVEAPSWAEAARHYFELCAQTFPELLVKRRPGSAD
jgi:glycosyltransferase involved in cell wall biosynthesis